MLGAIILAAVILLVMPTAIFAGGAIWSWLVGTLMTHDAEQRHEDSEYLDQKLW